MVTSVMGSKKGARDSQCLQQKGADSYYNGTQEWGGCAEWMAMPGAHDEALGDTLWSTNGTSLMRFTLMMFM